MKVRILFFFIVVFVSYQVRAQFVVQPARHSKALMTPGLVAGEKEMIYTLCNDELEVVAGVNPGVEQRVYICLPAGQWKGNKITAIEIGIGWEGGTDAYVFISKDLEKEPIIKQDYRCDTIIVPDDIPIGGWKTIPLSEPYVIDSDEDLYIGQFVIQESLSPFALDNKAPVTGGNLCSWRRPGNEWKYETFKNNVGIRVKIEGENFPQNHLRMAGCSTNVIYCKPGEEFTISGTAINEGILPVESFDFTYQLDGEEGVTNHITQTIQPMQFYNYSFPVTTVKEGKRTVTVTVSNPNGVKDEYERTTSASYIFGCSEGIQKGVLVEEIVGTDDKGGQAADQIIQNAIDKCDRKEKVVWIKNHSLSDDEYTITGFSNYYRLYGGQIFTPAACIDHKMAIPGSFALDNEGDKVPALTEMFIIDNDFGKHLEYCLDDERKYFSLGLECEVTEGGVLKIKMSGKPVIEGLLVPILQPGIALLLTEDSIVGKQAGVEGDYIHNHIPRTFIDSENPEFAFIGNPIDIPKEGFALETEYTIPDASWKIENMNLVFYLMDGNMIIQDVVTCPVVERTSVENNEISSTTVTCHNGVLHVEGEFDEAIIYNLSGQPVITTVDTYTNIGRLSKGIYCVKVKNGKNSIVEKVVLQ